MARNPRAQQGNAAQAELMAPATPAGASTPAQFDAFVDWCERKRIADGVVVVSLTHPDAGQATHREGLFSGFAVGVGEPGARWSDGSAYPA